MHYVGVFLYKDICESNTYYYYYNAALLNKTLKPHRKQNS